MGRDSTTVSKIDRQFQGKHSDDYGLWEMEQKQVYGILPPNQHTVCNSFLQYQRGNLFFEWLLVQSKFLKADKLAARNWPCNPVCSLYDQEPEIAAPLVLNCPFARALWGRIER